MLALVLTFSAILFVQHLKPTATQATPTPISPAATATPGLDVTVTPSPGVTLGPQPGPTNINSLAYWDAILGTQSGVNKVECVSFANMMDTSTLQALVTVRYTGADTKLDMYVFTNITKAKPTQIFQLDGLMKGQAKISSYSTVMTAEVDKNSTLNSAKVASTMVPDLFREFTWAQGAGTFVQVSFPGLFLDLTRWQAELDQANVSHMERTIMPSYSVKQLLKIAHRRFAL